VIRRTGYRTIYLGMNLAVKPLDDVRVRHAIAHAIDKAALVKGVLSGIGTLGGSYESSVIEGHDGSLPPYAYDVAQAKKLLAEAGHPNGFSIDFYVPTGRYNMDRQLGEAIQAQLAAVGIKANLITPEISSYLSTLSQAKAPMFLGGKGSPTGDMDFTQTLSNGSTGRMNHFNFKNTDVDKLILQQRVAVDPEERRKVLDQLQELVYREAPHVTLYYEDQLWATRSNVHDVQVYVNEFVNFRTAWKA
jgi:peptide/nickel transport system substrate-binding protein